MTPLLWLEAFLLAVLALAVLLGTLWGLAKAFQALAGEAAYRTADGAAMARDLRKLRRSIPTAQQRLDDHTAIRANAQSIALADSISGLTTANPRRGGSLEQWVWQSAYNHARAMYAKP